MATEMRVIGLPVDDPMTRCSTLDCLTLCPVSMRLKSGNWLERPILGGRRVRVRYANGLHLFLRVGKMERVTMLCSVVMPEDTRVVSK